MNVDAVELSAEEQVKLVCVETQIEPTVAESIYADFSGLFKQAEEWKTKAAALVITDASQVREMKIAREARLALKDIRVTAEKKRKALKEDSLRRGKAIDGVANILRYLVEPIEEHLAAQEQFVERKEAERKAKLKAEREEALRPYGVNTAAFLLDVMDDATFDQLLLTAKADHAQKIEAAKKVEADRIDAEAKQAAEKLKQDLELAEVRRENQRLAEERAKIQEQLERERQATAEANRKADEEQKRRLQAELNAAHSKLVLPATSIKQVLPDDVFASTCANIVSKVISQTDKSRMLGLAQALRQFFLPVMKTDEAQFYVAQVRETLDSMAAALEEEAKNLQ